MQPIRIPENTRNVILLMNLIVYIFPCISVTELSTGRMDPRVGVGSGHDFAGFWRVGSGQHFGFISILLIISWYLNRYESSNITFGLIDFHRYLIYNNYLINE